ncbi:sigma-70 family RNA polymerase sigma factor [Paenibacillus sp. HJL G12]|uniref:RNA polymerase sigma factor n=1 Tax=Paenibacillus dendrobii TaxID=2691084 RepID=A0A7X3IEZ8_9BACL|nr:sigma-70 family RNA polymerase sigma factor [Paenibacillus dendrobii]MWV42373.1 sigma-70 family RNA polymerase sigma factor [Paenibacillus dendrobii]
MSNMIRLLATADFSDISQDLQEEIYYEYYDFAYGMIFYIIKDHAATEDIIQDSFIKVIKNKPVFENEGKLRAWLKVVTKNTTINYLRKNKNYRNQLDVEGVFMYKEEIPQSPVSVENTVETKLIEESIMEYLQLLKPEYRVLLQYRWKQGLTYKEISNLLDLSEDVVKQRLFRARESIKKMLFKEWGIKDEKRKI